MASQTLIVRVRGSWNEYGLAYDMFLGNTCFKKRDSYLITYRSGNTATHTQIDFVLSRKSLRKLVMDVKVIPEEVALYHQPLVCDIVIDMLLQIKRRFTPRPCVWKLRDPQTCSRFHKVFRAHVPMHVTKQTRWSKRALTTSRLIYSAPPTRLQMLML